MIEHVFESVPLELDVPEMEVSDYTLLQVMGEFTRDESTAIARRLMAVAELYTRRVAERADTVLAALDPIDAVAAEVSAVQNISHARAVAQVNLARALRERLPEVLRLFLRGWIDFRMVSMIDRRTDNIVDEKVMARVDAALAARCEKWMKLSKTKLRDRIDMVIAAHDPAGVRPPNLDEASRYVDVDAHPAAMGLAIVSGNLNAADAAALTQRLDALAATVCADDPRTQAQRRADACGPLARLEATLACQCGREDCPAATQHAAANAAVIHLLAEQATLDGAGDTPGYLPGFGVLPAAQVRALAATAELKPVTLPAQADPGYRPSAAARDFLRWRDLMCCWPGCDQPVERADVDHTVPWPYGPTHPSNNKHYCRTHHLLKTFCGWVDRQLPDGTIVLTAPSGHTFTTTAHGAALFPALGQPTGWLDIGSPPPDNGADRLALMPRRTQTRDQNRRDRITAERRQQSQLIAQRQRQQQAWQAKTYQPPPF
ncbi:MAG TPA: HNH endonuclease signature motif containing protein [Pseudonocardiaceae bacterium]|nr:HNH endonuclease signature motif containing protein [Pseudonocardiaceae bacterium]